MKTTRTELHIIGDTEEGWYWRLEVRRPGASIYGVKRNYRTARTAATGARTFARRFGLRIDEKKTQINGERGGSLMALQEAD